MTLQNLQNLAKTGALQAEPRDQGEFDGLVRGARQSAADAGVPGISQAGQFTLAYGAAHAFAHAALRWHGFRSDNRYLVFQCAKQTLGLSAAEVKTLADCHAKRNAAEYQGYLDISDALLKELLRLLPILDAKVQGLA